VTTGPGSGRPPRPVLLGLAAAAVFAALWWAAHPPRPHQPAGDLFTHLSVARHLVRGEGFRTDIAYPLSFAWEFARELPQPLVHRAPGFAMVLAAPYVAAGGDPERTLDTVRRLQLAVLAGIAWLGATAWLRRARPGAALAWLVLLGTSPLLAFAVDWGHVELGAGLLLLGLWLRHRDVPRPPGATGGLLLGVLALLRPELVVLPVLWWLLAVRGLRMPWRDLIPPILVFLAVTVPWAVRNVDLTGDPFFSVQSRAEHVKDTRTFPGYGVYLQLEPQPLAGTLRENPVPVLRKTARGLRFFWREWRGLAPWPVTGIILVCALVWVSLRLRRWSLAPPDDLELGPTGLAGASLVLLAALYAVFDHSLRHLGVLLPILLWEGAGLVNLLAARIDPRRRRRDNALPWERAVIAAALSALLVVLVDARPTGWDRALDEARRSGPAVAAETERLRIATDDVLFTTSAAAPWFADRAAVWDPGDEAVREAIRTLLAATADPP